MNRPGPAKIFVGVALVFGSLFAALIPPFQSPDEPNHFLRAYQVSEGHFFPEKMNGERLGGYLPASLQGLTDSFAYLKNDYSARVRPGFWVGARQQPDQRVFLDFANTAVYAPVGYFPQALAMACLRPFGAGPLLLLYAARLANLFCWILLVWAALRLLPVLRYPVAGLALLPASLVIAASVNADVLTNGLCFWLFAAFLQPVFRSRIWQLLAFAGVCAAKLVTFPLGLLYALRLGDRRFFAAFLATGLLAAIIWGRLAQQWFIPYDAYAPDYRSTQTLNEGVLPAAQIHYLTGHFGKFLLLSAKSYWQALPSTLAHFVGKFGWEKNYLPGPWIAVLWLAILGLVSSETQPWGVRQRGWAVLVVLLFIGLFSVTMYILWCPVGASELSNLQGRYFVPIGPVLALVGSNRWLSGKNALVAALAFGVLFLGNVAMVWAIWTRWW